MNSSFTDSDLSTLQIRRAEPQDDDTVGELLVTAFVQGYARKLPEVVVTESRKQQLRAVAQKRAVATVLVAQVGGQVVGTVAIFPPDAEGTEAFVPGAADLRHLAVTPACKGTGIAAKLLDEAERIAQKEWQVPAICLHVRRGALGVASLYQKRGYQRVPSGDIDRLPEVFLEGFVLPCR